MKWSIIFCKLLSIWLWTFGISSCQEEAEPFTRGYDCSDSEFSLNISTNTEFGPLKETYQMVDMQVQILQLQSISQSITIHELELEKTTIVQTCGDHANTHNHWYHEILLDLDLKENVKIEEDVMRTAISNKRMTLGSEWGHNRGVTITLTEGYNTIQYLGVGSIDHSTYADKKPNCKGGRYTLKNRIEIQNALVYSIYNLKYFIRKTHLMNSVVPLEYYHDCTMEPSQNSVYCFNTITRKNYIVFKTEQNQNQCEYIPTRKTTTNGFLVTEFHRKVFLTNDEKLLFKITAESQCCGCRFCYETNYPGLVLIDTQKCSPVSSGNGIPPQGINMEHSLNLKMDYIMFTRENSTKILYDDLFDGIRHAISEHLNLFFFISSKFEELKLFPIKKPLYGLKRGEMVTILNCTKKDLFLVRNSTFCTKEIQVLEKGKRKYISLESRIIKEEYTKRNCSSPDLSNVFGGHIGDKAIQFYQEPLLDQFHGINGSVGTTDLPFYPGQYNFSSLVQISSFYGSGLYDAAYISRRREFMFLGERAESVKSSITRSLCAGCDWKQAAEDGISLMDLVSDSSLMEKVFGPFLNQIQEAFFKVLGVCGGIYALLNVFIWLLRKLYSNKDMRLVIMDRNSYKKDRKRQKNNLETDDEEGDSSSSIKHKKRRVTRKYRERGGSKKGQKSRHRKHCTSDEERSDREGKLETVSNHSGNSSTEALDTEIVASAPPLNDTFEYSNELNIQRRQSPFKSEF